MTTTLTTTVGRSEQPWRLQPGWGIFVDLTPPELLTSRQVRLVRKVVLSGLVAVLALLVAGYVLADQQRSSAQDSLANVQLSTTQLQHQATKYNRITQLKTLEQTMESQIASAMRGDVALDQVVYQIGNSSVPGMTITHATVTISDTGVASATQNLPSAIDNSGHVRIGDVTLTGSARKLVDVSTFVDRLTRITGLLDVVPTSNTESADGVSFNVTFGLDDRLLSHRFDAKGGK